MPHCRLCPGALWNTVGKKVREGVEAERHSSFCLSHWLDLPEATRAAIDAKRLECDAAYERYDSEIEDAISAFRRY